MRLRQVLRFAQDDVVLDLSVEQIVLVLIRGNGGNRHGSLHEFKCVVG